MAQGLAAKEPEGQNRPGKGLLPPSFLSVHLLGPAAWISSPAPTPHFQVRALKQCGRPSTLAHPSPIKKHKHPQQLRPQPTRGARTLLFQDKALLVG